ncbi:MAG: VOC family protein [Micropruina sp.]|nr:VOC family protein [Micropruina sp.]
MAQQLNPYITFNGNCAEAMAFYASVFGGTPEMMTFRESGMDVDGIMHASLDTPDGHHIFASDLAEGMGMPFLPGNTLQISLSGDEADALRGYWDGLSDGGQVMMPLERQMWGDDYGMVSDKYGVLWHVNIAGTPA